MPGLRHLLSLLLALAGAASAARAAPASFVLAVANAESFERDLPRLRHAKDDLDRFVAAMTETALVPKDHVVTVVDGTRADLRAAIAKVARLARAGGEGKFLFYFTGHSDAAGLHLADGRLEKKELLALLGSVPLETRLAFFDGCYSGALAAKGIHPGPDLAVPRAGFDEPSGSVFLAATSAVDVAYEVEELGGSLFTHDLVEGLYGSADANHDGFVTIDELYQYVYAQMTAHAPSLPGRGVQTPEYRVDLSGRGALIVAYVAKATVPLVLGPDLAGELRLSERDGLRSVALALPGGRPTEVRVVPGVYDVVLRRSDQVGRGAVAVKAGTGGGRLDAAGLAWSREQDLDLVAKGQRPEPRLGLAVGTQLSSYALPGPSVEATLESPAVAIERTSLRLALLAGAHANRLAYREQTGHATAASAAAGALLQLYPAWALRGQELQIQLVGGADYAWQSWDRPPGAEVRTFDPLIPKIGLGLGTSLLTAHGLAYGLSFRRDFPFAKDAATGDVLAFGANVIAMTVTW